MEIVALPAWGALYYVFSPLTFSVTNSFRNECHRSGPSISQQIKIWSTSEKEAEKLRRKDLRKAAKRDQRGDGAGGGGAAGGTGGGLDWLQSVGFEDEYLKQARVACVSLFSLSSAVCCSSFVFR